jgi:hypothetical protein
VNIATAEGLVGRESAPKAVVWNLIESVRHPDENAG